MKDKKEYILCAAIHYDDKEYHPGQEQNGTGIVYCGHRHHNIFGQRPKGDLKSMKQGFLTSKGRFVDRREALFIAKEAGQVSETIKDNMLFSEDLY